MFSTMEYSLNISITNEKTIFRAQNSASVLIFSYDFIERNCLTAK